MGSWGHYPDAIDKNSIFHILFNNPRGLRLGSDILGTQHSMSVVESLGAGALFLAETNVNWSQPIAYNKAKSMVKQTWKTHSMVVSHLKENFTAELQPGGTMMAITGNWTSRIIEKGSDPFGMGWWLFVVLRGKDNITILIITGYRVCSQTKMASGPKTSTLQQFRSLSQSFWDSKIWTDPIPRLQFIRDLQAWIEVRMREGHEIILTIDANEGLQESGTYRPLDYSLEQLIKSKGHDGSLSTLVRSCGIVDPLVQHHRDTPPPTYI